MPFFGPSASACASSASASASGACARLLGRRPNEALRSRLMFAGDVSRRREVANDDYQASSGQYYVSKYRYQSIYI